MAIPTEGADLLTFLRACSFANRTFDVRVDCPENMKSVWLDELIENCESFPLKFRKTLEPRGIQALHTFDNGYGVSVVKHGLSQGYEYGLYELTVHKADRLDSSTIGDVLGFLRLDEAGKIATWIKDYRE